MKYSHYWLIILTCSLFSQTSSASKDDYLQQLIQQAQQQKLSDTQQWHRLLHLRKSLTGKLESEVDDPAFFTAPKGKHDPQQELESTLRAFFSAKAWGGKDEPAQCAFIARYEWLNQQLRFNPDHMPKYDCAAFDKWYRGINPNRITLVFPSSYLNNPSSMFGHTLLRVDSKHQNEQTRLLAYAINYGAETGSDNGIAFAIKGIFGGYHGTVGIGPYYKKVKEYSDTESRDIWEYQLNINLEQIRRLLAHVWELRGVYSDYYFFDENCSYFVLTLLDVARPELDLSRKLHGWVIPSDTLRLVTEQPNLVQKIVYRPSAGTKLSHLISQMTPSQQTEALSLANGEQSVEVDPTHKHSTQQRAQQKADTLLLAYDYLRYEFLAQRRERKDIAKLSQQLLQARSTLHTALPNTPVPKPEISPELGHPTGMIQFGAGRINDDNFLQVDLRPAYHDLLDNDDGYIQGAQIDFLKTSLRHYPQEDKTQLNELNLIEITSLTPRNLFFTPISWRIKTGWQRRILPGAKDAMSFHVNGGAGIARRPTRHSLIFGLINLGIDHNRQLHDNFRAGYGIEIGAILQPMPRWKLLLRAKEMQFQKNADHHYTTLQVGQRINVNKEHALDIQWEQQKALSTHNKSVSIAWRWYL